MYLFITAQSMAGAENPVFNGDQHTQVSSMIHLFHFISFISHSINLIHMWK